VGRPPRLCGGEPGLVKDVHTTFVTSRDDALEHVDEIAAQAARWEIFDAATLATYFRTLDSSLGERQVAGIVEFARRAARTGPGPGRLHADLRRRLSRLLTLRCVIATNRGEFGSESGH